MLKLRHMMMKKMLVPSNRNCMVTTSVLPVVVTVTGVPSGGTPSVDRMSLLPETIEPNGS